MLQLQNTSEGENNSQGLAYQRPIRDAEKDARWQEEAQTPKAGCISLATHVNQNNIC
jgi:hypothetical protein